MRSWNGPVIVPPYMLFTHWGWRWPPYPWPYYARDIGEMACGWEIGDEEPAR